MFKPLHTSLLIFVALFFAALESSAKDLYWVGGSGNWNDAKHWSLISGGHSSRLVPTLEDNVIFDQNSFLSNGSVSINDGALCKSLVFKSIDNTIILNGSGKLSIGGDLKLHSKVNNKFTGDIYMLAGNDANIALDGATLKGKLVLSGGGTYQLLDNIIAPKAAVELEAGNLQTNNHSLHIGTFVSLGEQKRGLDLGNSIVTIDKSWEIESVTNLSVSDENAQIQLTEVSAFNFKSPDGMGYKSLAVKNPPLPSLTSHTVTVIVTDVTCNLLCNGTATAQVAGGTGPFGYSWSPGNQTTQTISNLCAGAYIVAVVDSFDMSTQLGAANVTEPTSFVVIMNTASASCNGVCDGSATAIVGGGTAPYTYSWSDGQTNSTATGLCAGSYTLNIRDNNGCQTARLAVVTQPNVLAANGSSSDISCNGICDGVAMTNPSGGTTPYTYSWDPGAIATQNISNLCAGSYTATVTDKNGCVDTYTTTITEPTPLSVSTTSTNVTCGGTCDGTAGATPAGGTGPYTYAWSPGGETTANVSGLCAGNYTVIVSDANGCTQNSTISITEPTVLTVTSPGTDVTCFGACDGSSLATPSGGTTAYTYSWSNGPTTSVNTGLCPGDYTITITDANSCVATSTVTITEPLVLAANGAQTNINCNGNCDGTATLTPSGGTSPYTYLWSPGGETTSGISNLCLGTYTVTLTDANGCTDTYSANITQPTVMTLNTNMSNVTCGGLCDGTAGVTPLGGTSPYTYSWSPGGETSQNVTGLCAGSYTVLVTDANGCTDTRNYTVTEPAVLTGTTSTTDVTCNGACDGTATIAPSGGTTPYTYLWSNGATTATATGLCPGDYTITVTDFSLCITTSTVSITEPLALTTGASSTNISCNGVCDGTASTSVAGGTSPYTYAWSPGGETIANLTGLCAGNYTVQITDANSCVATSTMTITQPTALSANISGTNILCGGVCVGTASVSASGGTSPYTYLWSPGGETTSGLSNLCAGTYTVDVTDNNSCVLTRTVSITEPTALTLSVSSNSVNCNGFCTGSASVSPSGGSSPYTYSWTNGATAASVTGLCAGDYTITVTDANSCVGTETLSIAEPPAMTALMNSNDASCNGVCDGDASVTAGGGTTPYTYSWSPGGQTTSSVTGLCAGTYTLTLQDAGGCLITNTVTITEPIALASNLSTSNVSCAGVCDGSASVAPSGGTSPYTYSWSPGGETTANLTGLCAGNYSITITDALGCVANQTLTITEPSALVAGIGSVVNTCSTCSGLISISPSGGTSPYTYSWNNGQTTQAATGLCVGSYTVAMSDANGCTVSNSATVNQIVNISLTVSSPNITCNGACDGIATANPSGGVPPYTYSWSPGSQTTQSISGLCAGTYTVNVQDALSCFNTATVTLTEPAVLTLTTSASDASCNAVCDGSATATPGGGTAPYTYAWSPGGETSANITGLCAGSYTVDITDANGCTQTSTVTVTEPSAILPNATANDANCGATDGSITLAPSGGTGPYTYSWAPGGETTQNLTGLGAGTFTVTITDAGGCTSATSIGVSNPTGPTVVGSQTDPTCGGDCDGVATVTVTAGSSPYTYQWSPGGETTTSITGLCAGVYNAQVTDNIGCITVETFTITDPGLITPTITANATSCGASCDGAASISVGGGTGPYTYSWAPGGATTTSISGLCAGDYTVTITDANSCTGVGVASITQPSNLSVTVTPTDITCNGDDDGGAVANVSGGTTPYTYNWLPGGEIVSTVTNLAPGTYTVNVTDDNSCLVTATVSITEPPALSSTLTATDASCNSVSDGTASVVASGGTGAFTYSWNPGGNSTASITGLSANTYTAIVTDANGCVLSNSVTVNEPIPFNYGLIVTDASCNGDCDGVATTSVTGGSSPYTYSWAPGGETTDGLSNLCAGSYTLTITDANSCTGTQVVTITEPSPLMANPSAETVTCAGNCDGAASVAPTGGSSPYTYAWSTGETTSSISGLCTGSYTITVTDANSCTDQQIVVINDPTPITGITSSADASCGVCNGSLGIVASGGIGSTYSYLWSPGGETTANVTGLCAGLFTVTVTDSVSCAQSFTLTLNNNGGPTGETINNTHATCNGDCNGTTLVTPTGGTTPYTYSWVPGGQTTNSLSNLCAGAYLLRVTDNNGCIRFVNDTITEPDSLLSNATVADAVCVGACDGSISLAATGGSGPYTYSWQPGGETTSSITGLCPGTYTLSLTDSLACNTVDTFVVGQATIITIAVDSIHDISCNGLTDGFAIVSASGGVLPYTYQWNDPGLQTDSVASGLASGDYTVTVTDAGGCIATQTVSIVEPNSLVLNPTITDGSCDSCNGQVALSPSGGVLPYTFSWNDGQADSVATGLCAGTYNIVMTDANGCTITSDHLVSNNGGPTGENVVSTSVNCFGDCDGSATITPIGGTAPYTYLWIQTGDTTSTATGLCGGTYYVQIQDSNKCIRTTSLTIAEPSQFNTNPTVVNATCGACDGAVTLSPTGGTSPYTYNWSGGQTDSALTALCAGVYSTTITDANGCSQQFVLPVVNPNGPTLGLTVTDVNCADSCNGTATVSATGNSPFDYTWSTGETTTNVSGLCAGTNYYVQVSDVFNCVSISTYSVSEPAKLVYSLPIATDPTCYGDCNGSITSLPLGGTAPYTFNWAPSGGTNSSASGLCAGSYSVTLVDDNGCSTVQTTALSQPDSLTISNVVVDATCSNTSDGSITLTVSGGTQAYTYQWVQGSTATSKDLLTASPGSYSVIVTDASGCTATDSMTVSSTIFVDAIAGADTSFCEGDTITISADSSIGTSFRWFRLPSPNILDTSLTTVVTPLPGSNTYMIVAYNSICTDTDYVDVTSLSLPIADAGDDQNIFSNTTAIIGGNPTGPSGSAYAWEPNFGLDDTTLANPVANPTVTTTYTVTVTNSNGCSSSDTVRITVLPKIIFPNGLSPNGDGKNDVWIIDNIEKFPDAVIEVYNRWGELLFRSAGDYANNKWDGTYNGKELPVGTYYYVIDLNHDEFPEPYTGPITIMR